MPDKILPRLSIRQGITADFPLVKQICADVNGGNDYIPEVWEEWINNPQNLAFIVEMDRQPAGLYFLRLGVAGLTTGWLQGVRVSSAFRKQGLAGYILEEAIRQSRELGMCYLQYVTAQENRPMHRLAEINGFWPVGNFLIYTYQRVNETLRSSMACRLVTTSEFDEAYRMLLDSAEHQLAHGIYCNTWGWKPLSIDTFRQHLERREVYTLTGALKVLAIMHRAEDNSYWISFLAGNTASRLHLLSELTRKVTKNVPAGQPLELMAQLVQSPANEKILTQAGFEPDNPEPVMTLYELKLDNHRKDPDLVT
jgi:GNAT superfamily N-acetyltransferase